MIPESLEVRSLGASYGSRVVLRGVSFGCDPGQIVGIVGPNGAGKSTLLKALLGLSRPDKGSILQGGVALGDAGVDIAYMPQRSDIDWDFPIVVRQVVAMGCYRAGWLACRRDARSNGRIEAALKRVGCEALADRQIGELSGGQRQRVLLARTLVRDAQLVLLDEPFAAVDAATERVVWQELGRLRDERRQVLVVHHDLASAARGFDRVLLLAPRIAIFGDPGAVLSPRNVAVAYGTRTSEPSVAADNPSDAGIDHAEPLRTFHRAAG